MPELPPEILLKTFEHFTGNERTQDLIDLSSLCAVSRGFLEPARDVLYHHLRFVFDVIVADHSSEDLNPRQLLSRNSDGKDTALWLRYGTVLETLTTSPALAARVQSISILFDSPDLDADEHPDYNELKRIIGFRSLKRAVKRLLERTWSLLSPRLAVNFHYGPSWAVQGLIESLQGRPSMITHLQHAVQLKADLHPIEGESIITLLGRLPHLEVLVLVGLHHEPSQWTAAFDLQLPLRNLKLWNTSLGVFHALSFGSASTIVHLKLFLSTNLLIDLSAFPNLETVRLITVPADPDPEVPAGVRPISWIAPDPSFITTLSLGPVILGASLPTIPYSVQHLTLSPLLSSGVPATHSRSFFTSLSDFPRSHSALRSLHLVSTERRSTYTNAFHQKYRGFRAEAGSQGVRVSVTFADDKK